MMLTPAIVIFLIVGYQTEFQICPADCQAKDQPGSPQGVDVGCGIGGSSRHISRKYNAEMTGITLSPVQVCIILGSHAI